MGGSIGLARSRVGILKMFILSLTILLGTAGGIILGKILIGESPFKTLQYLRPLSTRPESGLITVGAPLPAFAVLDTTGNTIDILDVVADRPSILIFTAVGCEPCEKVLSEWQTKLAPYVRPEIRIVAMLEMSGLVAQSRANLTVSPSICRVYYDRVRILRELDVRMYPTIVGVDKNSRIIFVQSGLVPELVGLPDSYLQKVIRTQGRR